MYVFKIIFPNKKSKQIELSKSEGQKIYDYFKNLGFQVELKKIEKGE